ncbi:MAG: hypothetical protein HC853_05430 [Anaerolineae bacterium]|nr:hypothetical protein [Anaerolineae bacterium]
MSTASQEWTINVDAYHARRKVSNWLAGDVAMGLMGHAVTLVLAERPYWRIGVVLTSSKGIRGEVGTVDVDADTGEMLLTPELADSLLQAATALVNQQSSHEPAAQPTA